MIKVLFFGMIADKAGIHFLNSTVQYVDSRLRGNDGAYWFSDVVVEKHA